MNGWRNRIKKSAKVAKEPKKEPRKELGKEPKIEEKKWILFRIHFLFAPSSTSTSSPHLLLLFINSGGWKCSKSGIFHSLALSVRDPTDHECKVEKFWQVLSQIQLFALPFYEVIIRSFPFLEHVQTLWFKEPDGKEEEERHGQEGKRQENGENGGFLDIKRRKRSEREEKF